MLFNSLQFLFVFLPFTLAISFLLRRNALLCWITLISLAFYGLMGRWWFLAPMLVTVGVDYFVAQRIEAEKRGGYRKAWLLLSLVANLGLLAYFKYSEFFLQNLDETFRLLHLGHPSRHLESLLRVTLPAGISFYTFQTLSYILDVWNGRCRAERNFWEFASFVSFFPHLVAGPLTRHNQLIPQLKRIAAEGIKPEWQSGLFLFSIGLCKKVLLADRIGSLIDPEIPNIAQHGMLASWLLLFGYAFQIYFDFSGYSDMAIGLGRLWGVELPINFNSPYRALDPSDFWRRWHITLSQWLRDYVYIPLGGNRKGEGRRELNLMITMALGGLWHGANWTFVVWGIYHGALLVLHRRSESVWSRLSEFNQRNLMFILATIGWLFFRAEDFKHLLHWVGGLVGKHGVGMEIFHNSEATSNWIFLVILVVLSWRIARLPQNSLALPPRIAELSWRQAGLGFVTACAIVMMSYSSKFLYFKF